MKKDLDVVSLGEVLIDFTTTGISDRNNMLFEANAGGAPCNVLAMLRQLNKEVAFIGKVGRDLFGDVLEKAMTDRGILTDGLVRDSHIPTTLAFVHTLTNGEREFSFYRNPGADMMLEKGDIKEELIKRTKVFHYGSLSMTHEQNYDATRYAIELAKKQNCIISYDPNLRLSLWNSREEAEERIVYGMKQCDILKISEDEVLFVSGKGNIEEGISYIRHNFNGKLMLLTLGNKGSIAYYKNDKIYCPGVPQKQVIDTTGAGDTFCGAVLGSILEKDLDNLTEKDLKDMLLFANAAASIVVTRKGAMCSMPDRKEIQTLIDRLQ